MEAIDLPAMAAVAQRAANAARAEILPRFRHTRVELKADGSPVTEADRAAERAIRTILTEATPSWPICGEELGDSRSARQSSPAWVVDPIDGTLGFSRGIPLFGTLIALLDAESQPVLGLIDLPTLDECVVGWRGGGVSNNGQPVRASRCERLADAMVAHGDRFCFEQFEAEVALEKLTAGAKVARGYTDAFAHVQVICGTVDAMLDVSLAVWDVAATRVLIEEAGGAYRIVERNGKLGMAFGASAVVAEISPWLRD